MNRQEFLLKIQGLFDDLSAGLIEAYKFVLTDPDGTEINYNELYKLVVNEYKFRTAPMPAWLTERLTQMKIYYKDKQKSALSRDLELGKLTEISYDPTTTRIVYKLPDGTIQEAYQKIVEDETLESNAEQLPHGCPMVNIPRLHQDYTSGQSELCGSLRIHKK